VNRLPAFPRRVLALSSHANWAVPVAAARAERSCTALVLAAVVGIACATDDRESQGTAWGSESGTPASDGDTSGSEGASTNDPTEGDSSPDTDGGQTTMGPTTTNTQPTTTTGPSTSADPTGESEDYGPKFDLPAGEMGSTTNADDGETGASEGCTKIDFLFVIDNSGSMASAQTRLVNSFGPFIDTIVSQVQGSDYHIMVVDTDACFNSMGGGTCAPTSCDTTLGGGQVRGCAVPAPNRYLTSDLDVAAMKSAFQCVAAVGTTGDGAEMPMNAMLEAIGPLNAPGQCNAGFLRNDAVLVITIVSDDHSGWLGDDNENGFGGTPQSWFDAVVAAKKGIVENVVQLGLYMTAADFSCDLSFMPKEADQFVAFTQKFGAQGIVGNVCALDYNNPFFQQAVGLIDGTCETFVPPPE